MTTTDNAAPPAGKDAPTSRDELIDEGLAAARAAVAVIRQTFANGEADFDDAVKALPAVHRLIEHAERMEVARKDGGGNWPPLSFVIVTDASVAQLPPPRRIKPSDAVDIDHE